MGFGTEILFILMLGLLILGPKQLHRLFGQLAKAKAQFEEARRTLHAQLTEELDAVHSEVPGSEMRFGQAKALLSLPDRAEDERG